MLAGVVAVAQSREAGTQVLAPPAKITICHKTGSDTNSWRKITVSGRAVTNPNSPAGKVVRAHLRHTGDAIIPGTAACPAASLTSAPTATPPAKITICHKAGSATNPYRRITVSSRAVTNPNSPAGKVLRGHMRHVGDILMPGATPCPPGSQAGQGIKLTANLQPVTGANGSGSATMTIRLGLSRLCYSLTVTGLTDVTAAHIHRVSNASIVVPLTAPTGGNSNGCVTVDKPLLQEIAQNPAAFYVNVHTMAFPNGQVQGKLSK